MKWLNDMMMRDVIKEVMGELDDCRMWVKRQRTL